MIDFSQARTPYYAAASVEPCCHRKSSLSWRGGPYDITYLCLVSNKAKKLMKKNNRAIVLTYYTFTILILSFLCFQGFFEYKKKKGKEIRERMEGKDNKCDFFFLASFHSFSLLAQYVVASPPSIYPSHLELTTFVCKKKQWLHLLLFLLTYLCNFLQGHSQNWTFVFYFLLCKKSRHIFVIARQSYKKQL